MKRQRPSASPKPRKYGSIFPLLDRTPPELAAVMQQVAVTAESVSARLKWLLDVRRASQEAFALKLMYEEPVADEAFFATLAVATREGGHATWLALETHVADKKLTYHRANIRAVCKQYGIDLSTERNTHYFKFPHDDGYETVTDSDLCSSMAREGFPGARDLHYAGTMAIGADARATAKRFLQEGAILLAQLNTEARKQAEARRAEMRSQFTFSMTREGLGLK